MHSILSLSDLTKQLMQKHEVKAVNFALLNGNVISDSMLVDDELSQDKQINVSVKALSTKSYLFQACSFSKCILSFGVMLLVQCEKINLDDSVAEKLRGWKLPDDCDQSITIRQCLALVSGLAYDAKVVSTEVYLQTDPIPSLRDILEGRSLSKTGRIYSQYPAGSYFSYSGAGYMLLQQLIEDLTQKSYQEYINQVVFAPLGMTESTLSCPLSDKQQINAMSGYDMDGKQNPNGWYNNPYTASGGLWTTAEEMAIFMREVVCAFHGRGVLLYNQSLATDMLTSQSNAMFGLGFSIDSGAHFYVRKQGYNQGYYNQLMVCPENNTGIIIMTNSANAKPLVAELIEYYMDSSIYNPDLDEVKTRSL